MKKYFGTDGIRGKANADLTPELALRLGRAAVRALGGGGCRIVVGRDTRISGPMLESALVAGLMADQAEVLQVGVLPTPGVAYLTERLEADAGVVISASHNPFEDNGIKFFGPSGIKLPDDVEKAIESEFESLSTDNHGNPVGEAREVPDALERYVDHLVSGLDIDLTGMKVALDCANGSAYLACPQAFERLGASVECIAVSPDGRNINMDCGSTHPEHLAQMLRRWKAEVGFALDGDADRCMCIDETGEVRDGDFMMAINAQYLKEKDRLHPALVVSTVMSNLGFYRALDGLGIKSIQAPVGDRYVFEEMQETGALLGGEQSGHIIFREYGSTGDGTLTALLMAGIVRDTGRSMSELSGLMQKFPQVLINVRSRSGRRLQPGMRVWDTVSRYAQELGDDGRVLVRPSGTEPVERVMVEALDPARARQVAQSIADDIARELDQ